MVGEYIARKEDKRIGGTYIFHTIDWTNVKIKAGIKYGVITEINGTWDGKKYRILSVYRPCYGKNEGSLRVTMKKNRRWVFPFFTGRGGQGQSPPTSYFWGWN